MVGASLSVFLLFLSVPLTAGLFSWCSVVSNSARLLMRSLPCVASRSARSAFAPVVFLPPRVQPVDPLPSPPPPPPPRRPNPRPPPTAPPAMWCLSHSRSHRRKTRTPHSPASNGPCACLPTPPSPVDAATPPIPYPLPRRPKASGFVMRSPSGFRLRLRTTFPRSQSSAMIRGSRPSPTSPPSQTTKTRPPPPKRGGEGTWSWLSER